MSLLKSFIKSKRSPWNQSKVHKGSHQQGWQLYGEVIWIFNKASFGKTNGLKPNGWYILFCKSYTVGNPDEKAENEATKRPLFFFSDQELCVADIQRLVRSIWNAPQLTPTKMNEWLLLLT